jgi:hypothetical protein
MRQQKSVPQFADLQIGQQVFHGTRSSRYLGSKDHVIGLATVTGITKANILTDVAAWSKQTGRKVGMPKSQVGRTSYALLRVATANEAAEYQAKQAEEARERHEREESQQAYDRLRAELVALAPAGFRVEESMFREDFDEDNWAISGLTAETVKKVAEFLNAQGLTGVENGDEEPAVRAGSPDSE